jgi:hypothetical protein
MEARLIRTALAAAVLMVSMGARYPSANFIVETADSRLAPQIAQAAEKYRHDLAIEWLGQPMPNWSQPCRMTVEVGPQLGAGGATTFVFDNGEVFGWRMTIQGSAERIFDSVLPHEITHMVFASHFRRPLPRWADEGGATSVEHASEKQKHRTMLVQFLRTGRGIPFSQMFVMADYPSDVMPLYAQGYSLAEYLIELGGRRKYIAFLAEGLQDGQWSAAIQRHYGIASLGALQSSWVNWVAQGFPEPRPRATAVVAAGALVPVSAAASPSLSPERRARPEPNLIYRIRDKQPAASMAASPPPAAPPPGEAAKLAAQPRMMPISGWHLPGAPVPAVSSESTPAQVSRPQSMEPSRQIIVE